jgi:hypothetical protein
MKMANKSLQNTNRKYEFDISGTVTSCLHILSFSFTRLTVQGLHMCPSSNL